MREIRPQAEQGIVWRNPKSIFKYNGWPSVCRDERGVLYATASSFRIQHVDPVGKNAMFVSFNDGKTWTRPIVVNDSYLHAEKYLQAHAFVFRIHLVGFHFRFIRRGLQ